MPPPGSLHRFDIPAGRLVETLRSISRQADVQIVTSVRGDLHIVLPLRGRLTTDAAIARVIAGQPLHVRRTTAGYLVFEMPLPAPIASAPPAPLPDQPPAPPIIVTGYRESLRAATQEKRDAIGFVEMTRAEDIAAFPDRNAADALQRLAGVTISRDNGEGRQISLRGLGPMFTRTTLNGIEALATTASGFDNRGSVSRQRRFDYSIFDASLFSQVRVEKSWSVDQEAGGIGGLVAMQTIRPFDRPDNIALIAMQGRTDSISHKVTPMLTAELSRRGPNWGALLALSYSDNRVTEYGYRNWDWTPISIAAANIGTGISDADRARLTDSDDAPYAARAMSYSTWTNRFRRLNIVGSVQHESDDGLKLALDLLYARLSNHRDEYSLAAAGTHGLTGDIDGTQILQDVTIRGDTITAARFTGVDLRTEHKRSEDHTDFGEAALSLSYPINDSTTVDLRAGYARSDFQSPVFDKVFLQSNNRDFSYVSTGTGVRNSYGLDLTDSSNWQLMRADTREDAIVNDNVSTRLTVAREMGGGIVLRGGGSWQLFGNRGYQRRVRVDYADGTQAAFRLYDGAGYADYIVGQVDPTFALTGQERDLSAFADVPGTDFRLSERRITGFLLADVDMMAGAWPFSGRIGLQFHRTVAVSTGTATADLSRTAVREHHADNFWLPSLEARLRLPDGVQLRFAASQNVNRPDIGDLKAAAEISVSPFGGSIIAGNPALRPFKAESVDLAVEHYDRAGQALIGLFFKHMHSFIISETQVMPYAQTGYPAAFLYAGQDPSILYNVIRPINGPGASIFGVEAAFRRELRFLPTPLDRLGVQANVTHVLGRSEVIYDGTAVSLPLVDLSRWSGNAVLYYTGRGWDARISAAHRGTYRVDIGDNGNIGEFIRGSLTIDAAAHLSIGKRLKMVMEARNLTNAPIIQYADISARRLLSHTRSGRIVSTGLHYAF
ncbi:TonB-dependent receptor [Sphingobium sp. CR2-8]|uniref:TonB-dependent receptor n=1 Tax=Sphingobium sp. CR2-8 TaxID=1306534 RepID=UPI002DB9A8DA|nr:TonB-dependent receptor [Sphingobium sp. CR2-8]MEC3909417.1 TonB-dependent receptor [Sphingobium sp. CR2-8]